MPASQSWGQEVDTLRRDPFSRINARLTFLKWLIQTHGEGEACEREWTWQSEITSKS